MPFTSPRALLVAAALLGAGPLVPAVLAPAPAAAATVAAATTSTNWAGYVVRRSGVRFSRASGSWTVPGVTCTPGTSSSSANWVGLGGYSSTSTALEQLGTESDCSRSGRASYSGWFEVVPAASTSSKLTVHAGDRMRASVEVTGHTVRLRLVDATRGTSQTRTVTAKTVDVSSAEWIVEAPSLCTGTSVSDATCRTTTLADVGTTRFTATKATTTTGHAGTIFDAAWTPVAITLRESTYGGGPFGPGRETTDYETGGATPAAPDVTGSAFSVSYGTGTTTTAATTMTRSAAGA